MINYIFTIHDVKADAYLPPFFLPTEAMAIRTFGDCIADKEHAFGMHPSDYTLFVIGDWENTSGIITLYEVRNSLGNGVEHMRKESDETVDLFEVVQR